MLHVVWYVDSDRMFGKLKKKPSASLVWKRYAPLIRPSHQCDMLSDSAASRISWTIIMFLYRIYRHSAVQIHIRIMRMKGRNAVGDVFFSSSSPCHQFEYIIC